MGGMNYKYKRYPGDVIWFTGRKHAHENLKLPKRYSPQEQLGFGIHFARSKDFAHLYGNFIYHCRLHPSSVLNLNKPFQVGTKEHQIALEMYRGTRYALKYWDANDFVKPEDAIRKRAYFFINPDITSPKRGEAIIRKYGYDAVFYGAKFGHHAVTYGSRIGMAVTNQTDAVVILDPAKILILKVEEVGE
jgi:hypothetical protein